MSETNPTTLLMVVDAQNGFINKHTEHLPEKILSLLKEDRFDHVIFTRFINKEDSPFRRFMNWHKLSTEEEIAIPDILQPYANTIFDKYGYTAITQEVTAYFNEHNIDKIYLLGIDTDVCVLQTAVDLFEQNRDVTVLIDYCGSTGGADSHEAGLKVLRRTINMQ